MQSKTKKYKETRDVMLELITWLNENTTYHISQIPVFYFDSDDPHVDTASSISLTYRNRYNYIVLREEIDYTDDTGNKYLVHELVHHAQFLKRKRYDCEGQAEAQAYRVENQYIQMKKDPNSFSKMPESIIEELASC
ncbi:MAG: hypothetical protein U5L75_01150 [Candidatus Campbellbacteria bacterium]|nr:hypothetical protein [Candidatus Campbellbacteria bacterium]